MGEFNWVRALDALGRGHTLDAVGAVRQLAEAFGVEGPIPLHATELHRAKELRVAAERNLAMAQEIEDRAVASRNAPDAGGSANDQNH